MNRIEKSFKNNKAFIPFITAGYPNLKKTEDFVYQMVSVGADLIEIGIPFSDPVAEGVVIQHSSKVALETGTNVDKIFELVEKIRKKTPIPLVFMTYINPVFKYGYDNFFKKCSLTGIDGIIIPDLPFEEKDEISGFAKQYDVKFISLIAPTSQERIKQIAQAAEGFLYIVSSMGVTGVRKEITTDLNSIVSSVKKITNVPVCVGFGIHSPKQVKEISSFADGVIVGSAIIKIIEQYGNESDKYIYDYVKSMKDAMSKQ